MPISQAKVKSVLSGDTLILVSVHNPDQERTLSLAFVSAPRLKRDGDEPYAFHSRDFLRRMVVGKVVQFNVLYTIPTGVKRDYGSIMLQSGESLPEAAVSEGWVKIRDDAGRKDDSEDSLSLLEKLELEEAKAKADSKGVWGSNGGKIQTVYDIPDHKDFLEQWKGKTLDSIVERVLSGDRMIVRLFLSPTEHLQTMVLVAGIRAPATKRTNISDGKEQPAEHLGGEAHLFVETRLLQRNVRVNILGFSPQNQLICVVKHPNGSIAEFILKAGLARCTDFHSTLLGDDMTALRQAEKHAKDKNLGLFESYVETKASETDAIVARVMTADTIYLRNKSGVESRASLSSIRQPKPTDPGQAPFQADAKEFLRKKLIGKHVRVTVDGKKAATTGFEEREVVTVNINNKNVAIMLVEAGYASVIKHRRDDNDRSPSYDKLLAAEETAQKEGKGMWSTKAPVPKVYQDYSENLQKAKIQCSVLQRQKKVPAMVDFVKSGSRFVILIPRENAKLTFVISGIRAPRSARNPSEKPEPFGQEAHDFANRRCMQRDVEIDVENTDKVGGFIGTLFINRENFAKLLLEEGLASVHAYSAEQTGNATELFAAEQKAKDGRKGMWHDYEPTTDANPDESTGPTAPTESPATNVTTTKQDYRDVLITHVEPTGVLKMQIISPSTTERLATLMSAFRTFHLSPANAVPLAAPKTGDLVAAKFSADGEWYRARVRRNDRDAQASEVVFIDYGNAETVPWRSLRALTQPQFNLGALKPQAVDAQLSFLQFPTSPGYLADAIGFLTDATMGRSSRSNNNNNNSSGDVKASSLVARVDARDAKDGMLWVTLFATDDADDDDDAAAAEGGGGGDEHSSINTEVVREGWAMVAGGGQGRVWDREVEVARVAVGKLRDREEEAREGRRGVWEYGDLRED